MHVMQKGDGFVWEVGGQAVHIGLLIKQGIKRVDVAKIDMLLITPRQSGSSGGDNAYGLSSVNHSGMTGSGALRQFFLVFLLVDHGHNQQQYCQYATADHHQETAVPAEEIDGIADDGAGCHRTAEVTE